MRIRTCHVCSGCGGSNQIGSALVFISYCTLVYITTRKCVPVWVWLIQAHSKRAEAVSPHHLSLFVSPFIQPRLLPSQPLPTCPVHKKVQRSFWEWALSSLRQHGSAWLSQQRWEDWFFTNSRRGQGRWGERCSAWQASVAGLTCSACPSSGAWFSSPCHVFSCIFTYLVKNCYLWIKRQC